MNKNPFILELDGNTYRLSAHTLLKEADFQSIDGCKFLVSDFGKSITRVMQVQSDIRYAEAVVARTLQNEGEFDEPITVLTHWKKKRDGETIDIFFTALTSRIYFQYLHKIAEHRDLLTLIPVFGVLAAFINQLNSKDPIAVIFRHGRFADLVIGKKNRFYLATQCVAFDTSPEQISVLWDTVSREISAQVRETGLRVKKAIVLNWIDTKEDPPSMDVPGMASFLFDPEPVTHENTLHLVSFSRALRMFPPMEGITPGNGKLLFYSGKLSPFFRAFFACATILMLAGSLFFQFETKTLKTSLAAVEGRLNRMNHTPLSQSLESAYPGTLNFVDTLFHNRNLPSYKEIINDISMGVSSSTRVEALKIDYPDKGLKIHLTGRMEAGFDRAYKEYQTLISGLQKKGYHIDENIFNTRIDSSRFELSLSRSLP